MKKMLWLCFSVVIFFASQTNCYSTAINISSSEYHVWGNVQGTVYTYTDQYQLIDSQYLYRSYDETSSSPISGSVDLSDLGFNPAGPLMESTTDTFSLSTNGSSLPNVANVGENELLEFKSSNGVSEANDAFAEMNIIFTTQESRLSFEIEGMGGTYFDSSPFISLYDITADSELFSLAFYQAGFGWGTVLGEEMAINPEDPVLFSIDTDPTHEYHLRMFTRAETAGDFDDSSISFAVSSVPEPATVLLFGTAIAGLAGTRLRRRKVA